MKLLNKKTISAGIACFIGSILDMATTYYIVGVSNGIELNPIMDYVINLGWEWFVLIKIFVPILVPILGIKFFPTKNKSISLFRVWVTITLLELLVVVFNSISIVKYLMR